MFKLLLLNLTYFYRMKIQNSIIIIFFLIITSCKNEVPLIFSSESFTELDIDTCKTVSCPEITINYIKAQEDRIIAEKINSKIQKYIIAGLNIGEDSISSAKSIKEAASDFIKVARLHAADFPDMSAEYFAEINVSESFNTNELVSVEIHRYLYTGGAHGSGHSFFLNIDPRTGNEIPSEALFKNNMAFAKFAEEKFRLANKIPANEPINATGFWFNEDQFYIPETIGFTETSLILIYNQYEIASYADGPIELEIPLEEIQDYLKFKIRPKTKT